MATSRQCSRQTCQREAVFTLTYAYSDSTAVIGALSVHREPHAYDLCEFHADRLTAPQGWKVVRVDGGARPVEAEPEEGAPEAYPPLRSLN
ncbi:MAG: DUF3499 family protein [Rothia sp. (in: high G+C Gram-positive bacteria)]|nr:DUF3499 family protein [Rothia sp. (in: high G+C Gram-positive bacteria)]